jgi:hypothetical protein
MWQTAVLAEIETAAMARGALSVSAVGSVAADAVDDWSDLDALVVAPKGRTADFWPALDWLPNLGQIAAQLSGFPRPTAVGTSLLFADGHKVDITVVEIHRLAEHRAMLADHRPETDRTGSSSLDAIAAHVVFDAVMAIGRSARGERLLATQLAIGLYLRCLDAAIVIRDLATGTCVHPRPSKYDTLADLIPPMPTTDVLTMVRAALDCFQQIIARSQSEITFPRDILDQLLARAGR